MKRFKPSTPHMEEIMPQLIQAWRRFTKTSGPKDVLQTREFRRVVDIVKSLKDAFDASKPPKDYFSNPETLGAYLLYFWPLHFMEGLSLIGELPALPKRVLDIGSGPCPMALAACQWGATDVIATDKSESALQLGADVCGRMGMPLTIRKWDAAKDRCPVEGPFDLIILGHSLEEIFPKEEEAIRFVRGLLNTKLSPHGFLLITEGSFPDSNDRLLKLRNALVEEGIPVQAPCVWKGKCPALEDGKPCYAQRTYDKPYVIKEIQRSADINLNSLKMSYLILKHPQAAWPKLPPHDYYRIISPPFETPFGKTFSLCGTDGLKKLSSSLEEFPQEARAFKYLRRGELISVRNTRELRSGYDIIEDSQIIVEAPCGKPIPESL